MQKFSSRPPSAHQPTTADICAGVYQHVQWVSLLFIPWQTNRSPTRQILTLWFESSVHHRPKSQHLASWGSQFVNTHIVENETQKTTFLQSGPLIMKLFFLSPYKCFMLPLLSMQGEVLRLKNIETKCRIFKTHVKVKFILKSSAQVAKLHCSSSCTQSFAPRWSLQLLLHSFLMTVRNHRLCPFPFWHLRLLSEWNFQGGVALI